MMILLLVCVLVDEAEMEFALCYEVFLIDTAANVFSWRCVYFCFFVIMWLKME